MGLKWRKVILGQSSLLVLSAFPDNSEQLMKKSWQLLSACKIMKGGSAVASVLLMKA